MARKIVTISELAGVSIRLEGDAIRKLHWHQEVWKPDVYVFQAA